MFRIGVQTINGVSNRFGGQLMQRTADPDFYDLLRALNTIQQSDGLGMRVKPKDGNTAVVMFYRTTNGTELSQELAIVQRILRVSLVDGELDVVFGSMPQNDRDLNSKRIFAFTMLLFSLTETGGDQRAPIVTVPTN